MYTCLTHTHTFSFFSFFFKKEKLVARKKQKRERMKEKSVNEIPELCVRVCLLIIYWKEQGEGLSNRREKKKEKNTMCVCVQSPAA